MPVLSRNLGALARAGGNRDAPQLGWRTVEVDQGLLKAVLKGLTAGQGQASEEEWEAAYAELHQHLVYAGLIELLRSEMVGLRFEEGELKYVALVEDIDLDDPEIPPSFESQAG